MVSYPPAKFRKRRNDRAPEAVPVAQTITILSVYTDTPSEPWRYIWVFSEPVTITALPVGLRVQVAGEWIEPIFTDAIGTSSEEIMVFYDTEESLVDCIWSVPATPTGIAEAAMIVVPETGIVEAI